jgi:hypothetical protein
MQRLGGQALFLKPVGGKLPTLAIEDEGVGLVPVFDQHSGPRESRGAAPPIGDTGRRKMVLIAFPNSANA